ncbi:uracil-DNA glycosylase [Candidatus Saccharibacteria bacterium]|nr:uracil-DNA glycosylase [Candidatus Saccharibacteria bacterium]
MIHEDWKPILKSEFEQPYFEKISAHLREAYATKEVFPPKHQVFSAFQLAPKDVKVVIIGQDPYHGSGQAHGLSFSVQEGVKTPPSLLNIYKEIESEFGTSTAGRSGNLKDWVNQGVFLLNNTLTVEAQQAGSHRGLGWEIFTANIIKYLNENRSGLIFLLWGRDARSKKSILDESKHLVLEAAHPSPLSAHNGFFGCGHFRLANEYLDKQGLVSIEW